MASPSTRPTSLVELAATLLREEILDGDLHPGDRIHITETAARFELSPIPLREGLRMLVSEGLVVPQPQRGYRVTAATVEDIDDTYRLRLLLDPMAVRLAVTNFDDESRTHLQGCFDRMVTSYRKGDWPSHRVPHREFHFAIYSQCDSPWLLRCISMLWENSDRYQRLSTDLRGTRDQRLAEHRGIMEAVLAGDPEEAGQRMESHLRVTHGTVRALLAGEGTQG